MNFVHFYREHHKLINALEYVQRITCGINTVCRLDYQPLLGKRACAHLLFLGGENTLLGEARGPESAAEIEPILFDNLR